MDEFEQIRENPSFFKTYKFEAFNILEKVWGDQTSDDLNIGGIHKKVLHKTNNDSNVKNSKVISLW